jgi:serine O-acetyltransferase
MKTTRSAQYSRRSYGMFAMITYRLMQASQHSRLSPLAMIFNKINVIVGQCVIGGGADFGREFVLVHSQGIVINAGARGGNRVFIEHQVTIGAKKRQAPVLGNDILVGAGAKLLGAVRVGDGVKIGANAVVTKDLPTGATACRQS